MKCQCGNDKFYGHQIIRVDVIVDEHGDYYDNLPNGVEANIYDAERPYGTFICTRCEKEYEELVD